MEYIVIEASSATAITEFITTHIENGWIPSGGINVFLSGEEEVYSQAITRTCKPSKTVKKSGLQPKVVIDLWNEVTKDSPLPRKLKVLPALENAIRTRSNEKDGFDTIEAWRSYFTAITRSNFLTGKNDRGWKADLEWSVKPKSITGVIEGKYHNG